MSSGQVYSFWRLVHRLLLKSLVSSCSPSYFSRICSDPSFLPGFGFVSFCQPIQLRPINYASPSGERDFGFIDFVFLSVVLGLEPWTLHMPGKGSTPELTPWATVTLCLVYPCSSLLSLQFPVCSFSSSLNSKVRVLFSDVRITRYKCP